MHTFTDCTCRRKARIRDIRHTYILYKGGTIQKGVQFSQKKFDSIQNFHSCPSKKHLPYPQKNIYERPKNIYAPPQKSSLMSKAPAFALRKKTIPLPPQKNNPALRNRGRDYQSDSSRKIRSERSNLHGRYFSAGHLPDSMRSQPRSYRSRERQDLRLRSSSCSCRPYGNPRELPRY